MNDAEGTTHRRDQKCYLCNQVKSLDHFIQKIDATHYRMCRSCLSGVLTRKKTREQLRHTDENRTCYLCRRYLSVSNFTRRSTGTYFSACKDCNNNVFAQRRRARKRQAKGSYTTKEWKHLLSQYERCPRCNRLWEDIPKLKNRRSVITVDHIIPLSKNGNNTIDNLQPLCYSCNSKKGDR